MLLASSYFSGLVLLVAAFVCFGIWPNFFKQVEARWRYELFALDFALGALLSALLLAYTLGTLGPEMSFTDRLLVAGYTSSIFIIGAGGIFGACLLLLLGSVGLLGMAAAFPVCFGLAALGALLMRIRASNTIGLITGALLLLIGVAVAFTAVRAAAGGSGKRRTNAPKGLALALIAGLALVIVQLAMLLTSDPDFGPGPYGSALMFALGLAIGIPCFNFFVMNIKVLGSPISFASYRNHDWRLHWPGLASGSLWTLGLLCLYLAINITGASELPRGLIIGLPALAIPAAIFSGLVRWREFAGASPRARSLLQASAVCYTLGSVAFVLSLAQ